MPYRFTTHRTEYQFKTSEEHERVVSINKFVASIEELAREINYATKESIQETLDLIQGDLEHAQALNNGSEDPI